MKSKKCLLILGGGVDQIPGIQKAKEMGLYTIVLDGNVKAPAQFYSDEFYQVSIKHFQEIEQFIKNKLKKKIDGVIAFGVDIPLIIAQTADLLEVNYTVPMKSALLSEDKFLSKNFMKKNNIAIPPYKIVNNISEIKDFIQLYGFPIVIKPVDNSASRGISFIKDSQKLEKYFQYALEFSALKKVQIEKYLDGKQVSTESFIVNKDVYNIGYLDRNYDDSDRFAPNIIENGGDMPSIVMSEKHKNQLTNYLKIIAQELNIENGIIKGDIVIYNDNLYIIEFALRLSGGNFSTICIPHSTGIDFIKISILLHLNQVVNPKELEIINDKYISMRYKFTEDIHEKGKIKELLSPIKEKEIILSNFHISVGDVVVLKTTNHAERLGFAIAKGETREESINNAQKYLDRVEIVCE